MATCLLYTSGLQNPGVDAFIGDILPKIAHIDPVKIANVAGKTREDYFEVIDKLNHTDIDMYLSLIHI